MNYSRRPKTCRIGGLLLSDLEIPRAHPRTERNLWNRETEGNRAAEEIVNASTISAAELAAIISSSQQNGQVCYPITQDNELEGSSQGTLEL